MQRKKPFWLILLTVLSMMGGLLGVIIGVLSIVDIELLRVIARIPGYSSIFSLTYEAHVLYPYTKILLYGLSGFGAFRMFMLKRDGFFLYLCAQLVLLIIPYFMWNRSVVVAFFSDLPDIIFTFAFIGAYWLYLPLLGQPRSEPATGTEK